MFLTPEELTELTGRQRRDAQVRALRYMGIEHRVRPDGTVAVLKTHVEQSFGETQSHDKVVKQIEPDWSAL